MMKKLRFGQGMAIFFLFFGVAMIDAIKNGNWWQSLLWIAFGGLFLLADNVKKTQ